MSLLTGLVSYWKLDESSGNAADAHASNTLTNNNTVGYSAAKINNGADYGAGNTNKYLRNSGDLIGNYQADIFSISLWLNITTHPVSAEAQLIVSINNSTNKKANTRRRASAYITNNYNTFKISNQSIINENLFCITSSKLQNINLRLNNSKIN